MESSDYASVGPLAIGPSTILGRAIALRVLFCKAFREVLRAMIVSVGRFVRYGSGAARFLFSSLNPRRPRLVLAAVIAAALLVKRSQMVRAKAELAYRCNFWRNVMKGACVYDEWAHAAAMLERHNDRRKDSDLYDEELVRAKVKELCMRRQEGDVQDILFYLRADLVRNLGNMCNPELHKGRLQVPSLIQEYIDEVRCHLRAVKDSDTEELPLEEKLAFIHETRHAYGRTGLLLSGGAALGAFHVGVVRTLIEHNLLPRVVAGASVGSIICSIIATRTWPELQSFFGDNMPTLQFFDQLGGIFTILTRLFRKGAFHEIRHLQYMLRELTQNLTFQEAYDMTGRVLGISVSSPRRHEPPRCLNYLTSPRVVIWSAVTASCAFPGLFEAQELMAKDRHGQLIPYHTPVEVGLDKQSTRHWRDGSLQSDLPMMQLKELFNVNHFIVSQANPHIAPLLCLKDLVRAYGGDFAAKLAHLVEMEVKHRCKQICEMGFPLGSIAKLFAQDWEGDVTIVLPATLAQFAKLIQNPTPSELQKAVNQGRRCTWEKLSAIKANCGIELMLDECVSELNRRRRLRQSAERGGGSAQLPTAAFYLRSNGSRRIPSWNCLAREGSWGSFDEEDDNNNGLGESWKTRGSCNGSDSEGESTGRGFSTWTRAGGPLMRTASATDFIQEQGGQEWHFRESGDNADMMVEAAESSRPLGGTSKRGNKIWEKHTASFLLGKKSSDSSDTDGHSV